VGRRRGLQSEVLVSLAVVMLTATFVLAALLVKTHEASVRRLRPLAARALLEHARGPLAGSPLVPGLRWWAVRSDERARTLGAHSEPLDAGSRELADEVAQRDLPLLRAGFPWEPVRFAAPVGGEVFVARMPPAAPAGLVLGVLFADALVFTAFGVTLLRRRLVRPLERLATTARCMADGRLDSRALADGPRETWEVANAFNDMGEALEARTGALEKAVHDLRQSNAQLREARAELDRSERLAAVGQLAAGVAHEVGNPMGAVLAFAELAQRDPGLSEVGRGHLDRVKQEGERVRVILRQLLDFSRPPRTTRVPIDLVAAAQETVGLVHAQRRYAGVELTVEPSGSPPEVLADRSAVGQILLNLLINALDALLEHGGADPRVRVRVQAAPARVRLGEDASVAAKRRHFDCVECRVSDNGPGVPGEDRERIFDPFFTTKAPGQGTGLGLSNAVRFAEELGGSLRLEDTEEGGACFVLRLPVPPREDGTSRASRGDRPASHRRARA